MLHTPVHAAAYLLDPEFRDHDLQGVDTEVMDGFNTIVKKYFSDRDDRVAANQQLMQFKGGLGVFSDVVCIDSAKSMPAW